MDKREADIRAFFDPKTTGGKKHKFIRDLKADYEFDNLIYGLGKYVSESPSKPRPKHLIMKVEDTPKVKEPVSPPRKKEFKAKLRDFTALKMKEPFSRELYEGVFCNTKIINPEILNQRKEHEEQAGMGEEMSGWSASAQGVLGVNPAASAEPQLLFPKAPLQKQYISQKRIPVTEESPPWTHRGREGLSPSRPDTLHQSLLEEPRPKSIPKRLSPLPEIRIMTNTKAAIVDHTFTPEPPTDLDQSIDLILMHCTKQIQSPFSDSSIVYYDTTIPHVSIQLLPDKYRDLNTSYTLQVTDLSVKGYPLAEIKDLFCDENNWIRATSGKKTIPLHEIIRDYTAVEQHTMRLVLAAEGANKSKRRLIERLLFFGVKDGKSESRVLHDLEGYRNYLRDNIKTGKLAAITRKKPTDPVKPGPSTYQCLLQKVQQLKQKASLQDIPINPPPDVDSMKMATPRKLQFPQESPKGSNSESPEVFRLPVLSASPPKRRKESYKHPVTNGLMNYRAEDLQYKHELYAANLVYLEDQARNRRKLPTSVRDPRTIEKPPSPLMFVNGQRFPPVPDQ